MATFRPLIIQRRTTVIKEVPREQVRLTIEPNKCIYRLGDTKEEAKTVFNKNKERGTSKRRHYSASSENDSIDEDWRPTGIKRHRCIHCPMKFKKPSALVIHMRTHSGERPYKCELCSKSFSISGNLRRHMFTHTGEKPYKCQACGRAFNNPSHLARHSKKIHI